MVTYSRRVPLAHLRVIPVSLPVTDKTPTHACLFLRSSIGTFVVYPPYDRTSAKRGVGRDVRQLRIERHAFPPRVELRPPRHAVDICCDALGGQLAKRPPVPSRQHIRAVIDRQYPLLERNVRSRTGQSHRKRLVTYCPGGKVIFDAAGRPT
jgi:hypothetical protein